MNKNKIRKICSKLLKTYDICEPPVPIENIAKSEGIIIRYEPTDDDISGILYETGDRKVVGVNSNHHPNRQRFTIAHELGHLLLHSDNEVHIDRTYYRNAISSDATDKYEIEANTFAAELLLPASMLIDDWGERESIDYENDEFIRDLAHQYGVSLQAMIFRLINIKLINP